MNYQLEVKQIVDYPWCRIYREFIRSLMEDRDIGTNQNKNIPSEQEKSISLTKS